MADIRHRRAYQKWFYRKQAAAKKGVPFNELRPVNEPRPETSDVPQSRHTPVVGSKSLRWRLRGLEIRRDLLSKCSLYEGLSEDIASNARQIQEVADLLKQAA